MVEKQPPYKYATFFSYANFQRSAFKFPTSNVVVNSIGTRFSRNDFEAVQKTCSTCFIGSKTTRLRLVVLNPLKHSRSPEAVTFTSKKDAFTVLS